MRIVSVVFALICAVALPRPGLSEPEKLGKVVFPTSCDSTVQVQFERGVAMLHSYWFTEARKVFDTVIQQDPSCAIAYWGLAVNYLGNSLAAAPSPKDIATASEGLDKARARLDRRDRRLLPRSRQGAAERPAHRVHQGDGADDAALSRRLRGLDVLCADPAGLRPEERQDLREPAKVGGDPGALVQAEPRAPRGGALPGPRLRLPAARRQGHQDRGTIRGDRASSVGWPSVAVTFLFDGLDVRQVPRL